MNIFKFFTISILLIAVAVGDAEATKVFAHRGSKDLFPENTMYAFARSIGGKVDGIELDVQLTKDNVVVLYHPDDLSVWTNGKGAISGLNYKEIQRLDAAYNFDPSGKKIYPLRGLGHKIPTLDSILKKFTTIEIIIDFKSKLAKKLVEETVKIVEANKAWNRVLFYSTNSEHLDYLLQIYPSAMVFENRSETRERLLRLRNEKVCIKKTSQALGFELEREMKVTEAFQLGNSSNIIKFKLWDQAAIDCIGREVKSFIFGVNTQEDYEIAKSLGVYAVFSDRPLELKR